MALTMAWPVLSWPSSKIVACCLYSLIWSGWQVLWCVLSVSLSGRVTWVNYLDMWIVKFSHWNFNSLYYPLTFPLGWVFNNKVTQCCTVPHKFATSLWPLHLCNLSLHFSCLSTFLLVYPLFIHSAPLFIFLKWIFIMWDVRSILQRWLWWVRSLGVGVDIMQCSLVDGYERLGGTGCVHVLDIKTYSVTHTRRQWPSFLLSMHIIFPYFSVLRSTWMSGIIFTLKFVLVGFGFSQIVPEGSVLENDTASVGSGIPEECNPQIYVCWPPFL